MSYSLAKGHLREHRAAVVAPYAYTTFPMGMGDTLTDWACESATFAQSWRGRLGTALDTATVAAVLGAGAAGLMGALIKRPLLGAGVGAVTGWAAAAIWTAPMRT